MRFLTEQTEFDEYDGFGDVDDVDEMEPETRDYLRLALIAGPVLFVATLAVAVLVSGSSDDSELEEATGDVETVEAVGAEDVAQTEITYDRSPPRLLVEGTTPTGALGAADEADPNIAASTGDDSDQEADTDKPGADEASTDEAADAGGAINAQATTTTKAKAATTSTKRSSASTSATTRTTRRTTTSRATTTTKATTTTAKPTTAAPTTAAPTTATPTTAATTTTAAPTTTVPPSNGNTCASNSEFERIFRDDFNGSSIGGDWTQYHSTGNAGYGLRRHSANSVSNGNLVITAKMENGSLVSGGMANSINQTYGKYVARVRTDRDPSKATSGVLLTWPTSGVHPRDGENNFYETLVDEGNRNPFYTFIHKPYGTVHDQEYKQHHADGTQFQVMTMEWTPNRITIKREGPGGSSYSDVWTVNETGADLIPDVSHHMTIQLDAWANSIGDPVRMEVDYVEIYKYCG